MFRQTVVVLSDSAITRYSELGTNQQLRTAPALPRSLQLSTTWWPVLKLKITHDGRYVIKSLVLVSNQIMLHFLRTANWCTNKIRCRCCTPVSAIIQNCRTTMLPASAASFSNTITTCLHSSFSDTLGMSRPSSTIHQRDLSYND